MAKVITGVCRFSYLNCWEPRAVEDGQKPKYSVSLIIPKSDKDTVSKIKAAIKEAYTDGEGVLKGTGKTVPAMDMIKIPLRDGDKERPEDPVYAGSYFVNASSIQQPGVVDARRQPIIDTSEMYSGVYGRASINFYAFNKSGNRGIACGLQNLQKIKDGDPLGGISRAEDDFNDGFSVETDDEDIDDLLG